MKTFAAIGAAAALAGTLAWWVFEKPVTPSQPIAPSALWAATFADVSGARHSLGEYRGEVLVANFWATWCAPCREEMPILVAAQSQWAGRSVRFVGLAADKADAVARFGQEFGANYPLLVGQADIDELGRRLGNTGGVLPYTAIIDRDGRLVASKVGAYSRSELDSTLSRVASNMPGKAAN